MINLEDTCLVGYDPIDVQHRQFIDLLKTLLANIGNTEKTRQVLEELVLYTKYHFICEEHLMEENSYPMLAEHRKIHQQLTYDLNLKILDWENGIIPSENILDMLVNWFINHTMYQDELVAHHIRKSH